VAFWVRGSGWCWEALDRDEEVGLLVKDAVWGGNQMIDKELLEILACPKCKSEVRLDEAAQRIICTSPTCGLRYPIRDGIPVMLIDEAEAPGTA
jgi:hypothetical protein